MEKYKSSTDVEKVHEAYKDLVKKLDIKEWDYEKKDIDKFKRYLLYFYKISRTSY